VGIRSTVGLCVGTGCTRIGFAPVACAVAVCSAGQRAQAIQVASAVTLARPAGAALGGVVAFCAVAIFAVVASAITCCGAGRIANTRAIAMAIEEFSTLLCSCALRARAWLPSL